MRAREIKVRMPSGVIAHFSRAGSTGATRVHQALHCPNSKGPRGRQAPPPQIRAHEKQGPQCIAATRYMYLIYRSA